MTLRLYICQSDTWSFAGIFQLSFCCRSSFQSRPRFQVKLSLRPYFLDGRVVQPRDQLENFAPRLSTRHSLPFLLLFLQCRFRSFELAVVFVTLVQWPLLLLVRRIKTDVFENCSILEKSPCNMRIAKLVIVSGTSQRLTEFCCSGGSLPLGLNSSHKDSFYPLRKI